MASLLPKPVIVCDLSPVTCHYTTDLTEEVTPFPCHGSRHNLHAIILLGKVREDTTPGWPGSWARATGGPLRPVSGLCVPLALPTPGSCPEDTALGQRRGAETIWMGDVPDPSGAQHQPSRFWWWVQPHRTSLVSSPDHQTCRRPTRVSAPRFLSLPCE